MTAIKAVYKNWYGHCVVVIELKVLSTIKTLIFGDPI